jgi:ribosomal protein S18 acetylase RimI-like enzyme
MAEERRRAFTIREARPDEYEALGDVTVRAYAALPGGHDRDYHAELRDVAGRAAVVPVLVAVDAAGRVLGGVTYVPGPGPFAETERQGEAGFRMLAVAPEAGGRGVGRALVEACVGRARTEGRAGMAITTRPHMLAAHHLYETLGFRRDPERDWQFAPGQWLWSYVVTFEPAM